MQILQTFEIADRKILKPVPLRSISRRKDYVESRRNPRDRTGAFDQAPSGRQALDHHARGFEAELSSLESGLSRPPVQAEREATPFEARLVNDET
jgi:hypothetical protein